MARPYITSEKATEPELRPWGGTVNWLTGIDKPNQCATLSSGIVCIAQGGAHDKHCHENSEELLYVVQGKGVQTIYYEDGTTEKFDIGPGGVIWVPRGVYHSTHNFEKEDCKLLAVYTER